MEGGGLDPAGPALQGDGDHGGGDSGDVDCVSALLQDQLAHGRQVLPSGESPDQLFS